MLPIYLLLFNFLFLTSAFGQVAETSATVTPDAGLFSTKKWGASYSNYMNGPTFAENKGEYSINHYLSLKHKFNPDMSLAVVFRPDQKVGNRAADEKTFTQGDSYLNLVLPPFYKNEGGGKIYSQLRYFAPISESSKKAHINGKIVPRIYATTSIHKFDLLYLLIPTIYLNKVKESGQSQYSQGHWLQVNYKMSDNFSLDLAAYPAWSYSRDEKSKFNDLPIYPGLTYTVSKNVEFSIYLEILAIKNELKTTTLNGSLSYNLF